MEFSVPLARRGEIPARPCRKAFWLPGEPDLPRMPAMSCSIADIAGFILRFALIHSIDPVWIQIELAPIGKSRKATG